MENIKFVIIIYYKILYLDTKTELRCGKKQTEAWQRRYVAYAVALTGTVNRRLTMMAWCSRFGSVWPSNVGTREFPFLL